MFSLSDSLILVWLIFSNILFLIIFNQYKNISILRSKVTFWLFVFFHIMGIMSIIILLNGYKYFVFYAYYSIYIYFIPLHFYILYNIYKINFIEKKTLKNFKISKLVIQLFFIMLVFIFSILSMFTFVLGFSIKIYLLFCME